MALDSRELMLEKFVLVNKERYPTFSSRLDKVDITTMQFDAIARDPADPDKRRVSNLASEALSIEAEEQSWECGLMNGPKVLNFTSDTIYTTLEDIINNHNRGVFLYQQNAGSELEVIQILPTSLETPNDVMNAALLDLNDASNYLIKPSEFSLVDVDEPGVNLKFLINGDTLYGTVRLIKKDPDKLIAGDWVTGYYGQILASDLISPEVLTQQLGVNPSKIINQGDNIWLKFSYNGKTILIAQKPSAANVSYDELKGLSLVDGKRVVTLKEQRYNVRVPKGISTDEYREIEDLLKHCSVNDPDGVFWEQFTDVELGVGSAGVSNTKGQWNWMFKDAAYPSYYIKLGGGISSETTNGSNVTDPSRGFRPVLILQGVNGIDGITDLVEPPPKRLVPIESDTFGVTDALPIKTATPYLMPSIVFNSGYDFVDYVNNIRTLDTSLYNSIPSPIYAGYGLEGIIAGIKSPVDVIPNGVSAPGYTGYSEQFIRGVFTTPNMNTIYPKAYLNSYAFGGETIFVIRSFQLGGGSNGPAYTGSSYQNLLAHMTFPPTVKWFGVERVYIVSGGNGGQTVYPIRSVNIPGTIGAPNVTSYSYNNLLVPIKRITVKSPGTPRVNGISYSYAGLFNLSVNKVTKLPQALMYTAKNPTPLILPATRYELT